MSVRHTHRTHAHTHTPVPSTKCREEQAQNRPVGSEPGVQGAGCDTRDTALDARQQRREAAAGTLSVPHTCSCSPVPHACLCPPISHACPCPPRLSLSSSPSQRTCSLAALPGKGCLPPKGADDAQSRLRWAPEGSPGLAGCTFRAHSCASVHRAFTKQPSHSHSCSRDARYPCGVDSLRKLGTAPGKWRERAAWLGQGCGCTRGVEGAEAPTHEAVMPGRHGGSAPCHS